MLRHAVPRHCILGILGKPWSLQMVRHRRANRSFNICEQRGPSECGNAAASTPEAIRSGFKKRVRASCGGLVCPSEIQYIPHGRIVRQVHQFCSIYSPEACSHQGKSTSVLTLEQIGNQRTLRGKIVKHLLTGEELRTTS